MIACLGETTGTETLQNILQMMKISPEGAQILSERPRINSNVIDLDALSRLPTGTFGYAYKKFLDDNVSEAIYFIKFNVFDIHTHTFFHALALTLFRRSANLIFFVLIECHA